MIRGATTPVADLPARVLLIVEAVHQAQVVADAMSEAWLAFARSGDPNHQASRFGPSTTPSAAQRWCSTIRAR